MAVKDKTQSELDALEGTRHTLSGGLIVPDGTENWADDTNNAILHAFEASAGWFQVREDQSDPLVVHVNTGRVVVGGTLLTYAGGTKDLTAFDDDVAYVWLEDDTGATIDAAADGTGWPATAHMKLAEVTMVGGAITAIVDRRPESIFAGNVLSAGTREQLLAADANGYFKPTSQTKVQLRRWEWELVSAGDTGTPTRYKLKLLDAHGNEVTYASDVVRIRACQGTGYADATNATVAVVATKGTVVETITTDKDLVIEANGEAIQVDLTNATAADEFTIRCGPAPVGGAIVDCRDSAAITHAAP